MPPKFGQRTVGHQTSGRPHSNGRPQGGPAGGASDGRRHAILLVQPTSEPSSRTYTDHDSVNSALLGLVAAFEDRINQGRGPRQPAVAYSADQLLAFIDALADVALLAFDAGRQAYVPHGRKFVKDRVFQIVQRAAARQ